MNTYIGIDLGTSSVKLMLVSADGAVVNTVSEQYLVFYPKSGWSEQNPADWYAAVMKGIPRLLGGFDAKSVKGISFGGQMHGLVALDGAGEVIRPAILWNDGRTEAQTKYLNEVIGEKKLTELTANIAFAGFTAPKILWLKENEPENFARIAKIMLPKDYLAYKLCGEFSTDYSDASGTLLLDVENRCWSKRMCEICGVKEEWLPKLYESYEKVGILKSDVAKQLGLSSSVVIAAGAGDNAAAAIGTGTIGDGACNLSIGTSGTIFISSDSFREGGGSALHSFCHADGNFHLMGCILSAASCSGWWVEEILHSTHALEQANAGQFMGKNDVFFLPYLMGERSPHNDTNARGAFIGMRPDTSREKMTLAVLEGVAFGLRDCLEAAKASGVNVAKATICGGGAKSALWKDVISAVLGLKLETVVTEEGPAFGAALLAMTACGEYANIKEAAKSCVKVKDSIAPKSALVEAYNERYSVFHRLYPALKDVFKKM